MDIKTVGVMGAGTMGNGIAQVCAATGLKVTLHDLNDTRISQGLNSISESLDRLIKIEKISPDDKLEILDKIDSTTRMQELSDVDIVIEAITENQAIKLDTFQHLDQICKKETILASNTSSISLTRLAAATQRPEKVIGMHFMNPVPMMALVEIIRAIQTDDATCQMTLQLSKHIGKVPVEVNDSPGFVSNRILMPMINEAAFTLHEGVATAEAIDEVMKLGMAHPMGPLMLADLIGLDTCLSIIKILHQGFADSKYRPCPLLQQMVDAGYLGRKSGRGFYRYDE